jgi:fibronectin type 3 domain-containing protein
MTRGILRSIFFLSVLHLCSICAANAQIPTNGMVAYYPLDGTALDQSGNGHDGMVIAATPTADRFGKPNSALRFNGSTDYVRLGNIFNSVFCAPIAKWTITGWALTESPPPYNGGNMIIGKAAGGTYGPYQWSLDHDQDGRIKFSVESKSDATQLLQMQSGVVSTGRWFFYAMVFDGSQTEENRAQLYVDGSVGTLSLHWGPFGTNTEATNQEITIGAGHAAGNPNSPNNQYRGSVDDIRIYDRVLSASEIDALFHQNGWTGPSFWGEYTPDPSTILLLHENELSGTTAFDGSTNSTNGTATGTSVVAGRFGSARNFNGSTDFIEGASGKLIFSGKDYTLEAWIKTSSNSRQGIITTHNLAAGAISNTGLYVATGASAGSLDMDVNNGQGTSGSSTNAKKITDGKWHHVAGVRQGSVIRLYVDGRLDFQKSLTQEPLASTSFRIGQSAPGSYFNGTIDEVRISSKARQPNEFNLQLPPFGLSCATSSNLANLTWQNGGGRVGLSFYRIYRGLDSTSVGLVDSSKISAYANTGLPGGKTYFYRVSAVDSSGFESSLSYAASAAVTGTLGQYMTDANTFLLLHMDETGGTNVLDASDNSANGVATGTTVVAGRLNYARNFNGTTDYIEGSASVFDFASKNFTLEAWVKTTSTVAQSIVTSHNPATGKLNNVNLFMSGGATGGTIDIDINNGLGTSGSNLNGRKINDGQWHHVAAIRNGTSVVLYVDGMRDFQKVVTQEPNNSTIYRIGQSFPGAYFNGVIDEVRVSSVARSSLDFGLQLPPTNLTATAVGYAIRLTWLNGGGTMPFLRYKVYRGNDSTNVTCVDSTGSTIFTDVRITTSTKYFYRVSTVDAFGLEGLKSFATPVVSSSVFTSVTNPLDVPTELRLEQNYPNPFNPSTRIAFSIPKTASVRLSVLDLLGREVAVLFNGQRTPGTYEVQWDATAHPSGIYICRIQAGELVQMRKMALIK